MRSVFNITTRQTTAAADEPISRTQVQIDAEASEAARAELAALDLASIRALREYVAGLEGAPQILKEREAAAVVARGKLK